jgi:hypothetical protein
VQVSEAEGARDELGQLTLATRLSLTAIDEMVVEPVLVTT